MSLHLKRSHEHERRRRRNGGGTTTELASFPPGADAGSDFAWRVSLADVVQSGRDRPTVRGPAAACARRWP
ncbi:HutD family protein [Nocardioides sp.]|uniref:HutD family protein n=1 Tax=Nocardioides sp. TaxID=35761 RepID=UPI00344528D9